MAKKSEAKSAAKSENKLALLLQDERFRYPTGIIILLISLYFFLAFLSYLVAGSADQSVVGQGWVGFLRHSDKVQNWTGTQGAYIAELFINRSFGIAAFLLLIFPFNLGMRLIGVKKTGMLRSFILPVVSTVWLSVLMSFAVQPFFSNSFLHFGGTHGDYIAALLQANLGIPGTLFMLVGIGLVIAIFAFAATLPLLKRLFSHKDKTQKPIVEQDEEPNATLSEEEEKSKKIGEMVPPEWYEQAVVDSVDDTVTVEHVAAVTDEEELIDSTLIEEVPAAEDEVVVEKVAPKDTEVHHGDPLHEMGVYDPTLELSDYKFPTLDLLKDYPQSQIATTKEEQEANQRRIITTLKHYGIGIKKIIETVGPTITLYEIVPEDGIRISKIRNLEPDIMLSLAATGIRIIAPIPGKGTIGIEVPNTNPRIVSMFATIASKKFQESSFDLPVALGRTITNEVFMFDLCKMPHLLVAGATGQGKSVGLNAIITSLLYKKHPAHLKFVLVDPKKVEFNIYSDIEKHFLAKLPDGDDAVITDTSKVVQTLNSLCKEMDQRYDLLKSAHVRNIKEYNERFINRRLNPEKGHKFLPYIVVIVDEFGDLIMTAGKEVEMPIARIAQLARAVGIHMILATQRPSVNIITGVIKANFPARIAFKVSSQVDSKTILDGSGAQQLVGRGDMLFSQGNDPTRVQCAFVDTPEVENIVHFISEQRGYHSAFELPEADVTESDFDATSVDLTKRDSMFEEAARLCVASQQGSTSNIQRKFSIGYNRAGRIMDQLEAAGVVGPFEGSKSRQVLVQTEYELEQLLNTLRK